MQEYNIIMADTGDALFVIIFIIIMIIRQFAKLVKPQTPENEEDFEITFGKSQKTQEDAQAELEAFLQNLTGAPKPAPPPRPAAPPKPKPAEHRVQQAQPAQPRDKKHAPKRQPHVIKTASSTPTPKISKTYTIDHKPITQSRDAYRTTRHVRKISGGSSLHKIRMDIGADLINMTGMRKAIVLNEILGPPLALKKKQPGLSA